jgi:M6 family metalloprotease-like protein
MRKSNLMSLAVDRHVASGKSDGLTRSLLCVCLGLIAVAGAGPARADAPFRGAPVSANAADRRVVERLVGDKAARLGRDGSPALQAARLAGRAAPDSLVAAVLMCDFADSLLYGHDLEGFPSPRQRDFYYTAHDALYFDHQFADVRSYFDDVSGGRFEFRYRVHPEVVNLAATMAWYGNHPEEGEQKVLLARDVVAALDADIDFSRYDTVVIVHAGAGEETDILGDSPEQIYSGYLGPEDFALAAEEGLIPQAGLLTDDELPGGGFALVDHVLILPENEFQDPVGSFQGYFGSLGVYCFEVGLRLGMLSLSDFTPVGRPDSQGVGEFCLMGYGLFTAAGYIPAHPCAFNKMLMGWLDPFHVDPDAGDVLRLYPAEHPAADSTLARVDISPQEYWLVEYRRQDPDGNRIFSFPGDLNGNHIPDFFDADSDSLDGTPTGWYDPETDQREWLDGAEFDFFMSENQARADGVKGAGSGLYVWHVDESVIRAVAGAEGNLYNADPRHKSVDLEEADGIQDLDDNAPSAWFLGGDHDSFRGEGATRFGPDTRPATVTASGLATGILLDGFTDVVRDSVRVVPGETEPVIGYAPWMEFRCSREPLTGGAEPVAVRDLPGRDLRGRHLVAADLDWPPDGTLEIVTAADGGRVLAFRSDLSDYAEAAPEPGLLAAGRNADGTPAAWTGPPLVADVDGDGRPEIVLTAPTGLFVFNGEDGSEAVDIDPISNGLALPLTRCAWPPVLAPDTDGIVVVETWDDGTRSRLRVWPGGAVVDLPQEHCSIVAPPVRRAFPASLVLLVNNHEDGRWERVMWLHDSEFAPVLVLTAEPAAYLPQFRAVPQPGEFPLEPDYVMAVATEDGGAMVLSDLEAPILWPATAGVATPFGPDFTHAARDGAFHCSSGAGAPRLGWPQRPATSATAAAPGTEPQPLAFDLDGARRYLFTSPDGRLFLFGQDGVPVPGWPLSGAGETAGTPLLMNLDHGPGLELVAAGSFARITGVATSGGFTGEPVSRLAVWSLAGTSDAQAVWPMYGGSADRETSLPAPPVGWTGAGLLAAGSHVCYPSPLTGPVLRVRADVLRDCGVRVFLYNLEGEEVAVAAAADARAGEPVEVRLDLPRLASGLYLCRLVAEGGGRSETSVVPVAVSR